MMSKSFDFTGMATGQPKLPVYIQGVPHQRPFIWAYHYKESARVRSASVSAWRVWLAVPHFVVLN